MNPAVTSAATAYLGPKLLRGFRLRWLLYGAAAYYGLRLMSKNGIFAKQADTALGYIDQGIGMAKRQVGLDSSVKSAKPVEETASLTH